MYLLRAVRPLLASRFSRAAPLRGKAGKVAYYNKAERELVMLPSTTIAVYVFSGCFSSACLYLAYRFIKKAGERDIRRDEYLEKAYKAEYKPRPWPPKSDEINAEEEVAEEEGKEAKDEVGEKAKAVSADEAQLQDKACTDSTEMQKEEGSPHEEAPSGAQEEEQGAASNMGTEETQGKLGKVCKPQKLKGS